MSVAAAVRITSRSDDVTIAHAAAFARRHGLSCYVISVVDHLPYGDVADAERDAVLHRLQVIAEHQATPVMQEGNDVAGTLLAVATRFGVTTLFLRSGAAGVFGRSIAEQLLYLNPPFEVVVLPSE